LRIVFTEGKQAQMIPTCISIILHCKVNESVKEYLHDIYHSIKPSDPAHVKSGFTKVEVIFESLIMLTIHTLFSG